MLQILRAAFLKNDSKSNYLRMNRATVQTFLMLFNKLAVNVLSMFYPSCLNLTKGGTQPDAALKRSHRIG